MSIKSIIKECWEFLKADTWQSWIVSIILVILVIKLIFFPALSYITGSNLPLVVVESCSMYHESSFDEWWSRNSALYESKNISKQDFESFKLKNGLNKGDIVFVWGNSEYKKGDIIIFNANTIETKYPIIHRLISLDPLSTKGDNGKTNSDQLDIEKNIDKKAVLGKAVGKIPLLGWIKLIFFEFSKPEGQKGICR